MAGKDKEVWYDSSFERCSALGVGFAATWPKKEMVPLRTPAGADGRRRERRRRKFDLLPTFLSTSVLHIAFLSRTITHLSLVPQWPQKLQRPRWCVVLATLSTPSCITHRQQRFRTSPASIQPSVSERVPLLLPSYLPSHTLIEPPLARDRRRPTSVPQAPLRRPAHHRPAKRPADDRRLSALPLRSEEQSHRRRSGEDPARL